MRPSSFFGLQDNDNEAYFPERISDISYFTFVMNAKLINTQLSKCLTMAITKNYQAAADN